MNERTNIIEKSTDRISLREITTFSDIAVATDRNEKIVVTPFEKNKILMMYSAAQEILDGEMPHPLTAVVYPSYVCNHACPGCSYGELNRKENVFFDPNSFDKLLKSLHRLEVKSIELSGGGEPTLHPKFGELVKQSANEGFELGLLTNGSLLSGEIADLIAEHFTYIRVNIDASDEQIYNQMHSPPETFGFQILLKNLEEVISKRNQRNPKLTVGAKALVCQSNMNYIEDIINLSRDVGCDYIQFKPMRNADDSLLSEQVERVDGLIKALQEEHRPFLIYGGAKGSKTNRKCWLSPIHIVVDPLGDVYPCCHFQYRRGPTRIGNLFDQPIEKIWLGKRHKEVIRNLEVRECNLYDCRWHYYNEILWQVIQENRIHLNFI